MTFQHAVDLRQGREYAHPWGPYGLPPQTAAHHSLSTLQTCFRFMANPPTTSRFEGWHLQNTHPHAGHGWRPCRPQSHNPFLGSFPYRPWANHLSVAYQLVLFHSFLPLAEVLYARVSDVAHVESEHISASSTWLKIVRLAIRIRQRKRGG